MTAETAERVLVTAAHAESQAALEATHAGRDRKEVDAATIEESLNLEEPCDGH